MGIKAIHGQLRAGDVSIQLNSRLIELTRTFLGKDLRTMTLCLLQVHGVVRFGISISYGLEISRCRLAFCVKEMTIQSAPFFSSFNQSNVLMTLMLPPR